MPSHRHNLDYVIGRTTLQLLFCQRILCVHFAEAPPPSTTLPSTFPVRVIIHDHHPSESTLEGNMTGKLIHLPNSIEDLLKIAGIMDIFNYFYRKSSHFHVMPNIEFPR